MITEVSKLLSEHGISPTPQRLAIFNYVYGRTDHPSVDKVFMDLRKKIPTLSKTTVYATMQKLADEHLIGRVSIEDGEVRYDGSAKFHAHFKCRGCGRLFDVPIEEPHNKPYASLPQGFRTDDEQLLYYGLCSKCAEKGTREQETTKANRCKPRRRNEQ